MTLPIPANPELECVLLGDLLLDPTMLYQVSGIIQANDFHLERNRHVYDAIVAIDERRDDVDFMTVTAELERRGRLEGIGGSNYIAMLINATPTAFHAESHARELANLSGKRKMINLSSEIADHAYNGETFDACMTYAQKSLLKLMPRARLGATDIDSLVADRVTEYNLRDSDPLDVAGVATGFAVLDDATKGLDIGLHVWQAESSHGKTALALNVIAQASRTHKTSAGMFALEMTPAQLIDRLISMECGINTTILATGKMNERPLTKEVIDKRRDAAQRVAGYGAQVEYCGGLGVADIRSRIVYQKLENGIDIAFGEEPKEDAG